MDYRQIDYRVDGHVATITLDRPEQRNAFTSRMGSEIGDALAEADGDDAVRAVVLTGAGTAFCAGVDVGEGDFAFGEVGDDGDEPPRHLRAPQVRKPVIAAMNGHAIAVGMTLAMECDVRFAAEDAKFAFAFVRRGVTPELTSHATVARVAGLSVAAELLFTGRTFSGAEAASLGLVSRALPAAEVLPAALDLATEIATHAAPAAVALSKRLLWSTVGVDLDDLRRREMEVFGWVSGQDDAREGVMSFLEKRDPRWTLGLSDVPPELFDQPGPRS